MATHRVTTVFDHEGQQRKRADRDPIIVWRFLAAASRCSRSSRVTGGAKRFNKAKLESYECGIEPSPQAFRGHRFPVKYYLTAMLFIVFDIEIIFLYPWAVAFNHLGMFGLVEMILFIASVFVVTRSMARGGS